MKTRTAMLGLMMLVGVASLVALRSAGPDDSPVSAAPVAATTPDTAAIAGPGRVEPVSEEIDVTAELSGKLVDVLVDEGDTVAAGDVIAHLERHDYAARLLSAEARLAVADAELLRLVNGARPQERREAMAVATQASAAGAHALIEVERARRLFAGGVIPRESLDRAERDWLVADARRIETAERASTIDADARLDERARAEANVALARAGVAESRALLAKTEVRAPIAGTILPRHKKAGESVSLDSPTPAIVTLADTSVLRVRVEVDEHDVAHVHVGQTAWVTAGAFGTDRFNGRVVRVSEMLGRKKIRTDEPAERTDTKVLETLVELEPGARLPIGLRVDAFIAR